ncbi:MAG: hypothetical protein ACYDAB_00450 [bacterium]
MASGEAGAWVGGLALGHLFAEGGAALGTMILPGVGTVAGGVLGGLLGGFLGGDGGSWLTQKLYDAIFGRGTSVAALFERCAAP